MKKQAIIISIEDALLSQLYNSDNYIHANNALYLGADSKRNSRYITLLPEEIKEIDSINGSFLAKFTNLRFDKRTIKQNFNISNEIHNNIFEYLLFILKEEIDNSTKHPVKIANAPFALAGLSDKGYADYKNGVIPHNMGQPLRLLNDFINDDEWNIYTFHVSGCNIYITKNEDWRVLEWERLTATKEY